MRRRALLLKKIHLSSQGNRGYGYVAELGHVDKSHERVRLLSLMARDTKDGGLLRSNLKMKTDCPLQLLDVGSIWMKEFASALNRLEKVVAWQPKMLMTGMLQNWDRTQQIADPLLDVSEFPLQRGYARAPLRWMVPFENQMLERLRSRTLDPAQTPLICSTPFYLPVAERWPGPVAYYVTDLTSAYQGLDSEQVKALELGMCRVARFVFPNSLRISEHLQVAAKCSPQKIHIVPNATRASNIAAEPRFEPGPLPMDVVDLPRPILGVLGDLSGNMDWRFLERAIRATPDYSWLFVGPTDRRIHDPAQSAARDWAMQHARFVGVKSYGELQAYARCVDAAVLPYCKKEPTYSGSSTRFYEHLAALRPMIATRGFAELLKKEPLLRLVDSPEELAAVVGELRAQGFCDGYEVARWEASRQGTWEERARVVHQVLRLNGSNE